MFCQCEMLFSTPGYGLQAQEHAALARELLPSCRSSVTEKLEVLLSIHLTLGDASLMAAKYPYLHLRFTFVYVINVN